MTERIIANVLRQEELGLESEQLASLGLRVHEFTDGSRLALLQFGPQPVSWVFLHPEDEVIALHPSSIADSAWVQYRLGQVVLEDNYLAVLRHKTDGGKDLTIVDTDDIALSTTSTRHVANERLEESSDASLNTPLLREQRREARETLEPFIRSSIDACSDMVRPCDCVKICTLADAGDVYYIRVTPQMDEAAVIEGDSSVADNKYHPERSGLVGDNSRIHLLAGINRLLVVVDSDGDFHYLSQNFGKARVSADSVVQMRLGPNNETLGALINQSTSGLQGQDRARLRRQLIQHFMHKLINTSVKIYPEPESAPIFENMQPQQQQPIAYEDIIMQKLAHLDTDGEKPSLARALAASHSLVASELMVRYQSFLQDKGYDFIRRKLALIPEEWLDRHLEHYRVREELITERELLGIIASWEAIVETDKLAADITKVLGLYALAVASGDLVEDFAARAQATVDDVLDAPHDLRVLLELGRRHLASSSDEVVDRTTAIYERVKTENSHSRQAQRQIMRELINLAAGHPWIVGVSYRNMDDLVLEPGSTVLLAAELCPLYEIRPLNDGSLATISDFARPMPVSADSAEDAILASMVGGKWLATLEAIRTLHQTLKEFNIDLAVRIVFGDMGVIVTESEFADPTILDGESRLYQGLLEQFVQQLGVPLQYHRLSEFQQSLQDPQVPQFCVVDAQTIAPPNSLDGFVSLLGLEQYISLNTLSPMQARGMLQVLQTRLSMSNDNQALFQTLVWTYTFLLRDIMNGYLTSGQRVDEPNIRLGMEIAPIFFNLTRLIDQFPQARMPAVNVQVEKSLSETTAV